MDLKVGPNIIGNLLMTNKTFDKFFWWSFVGFILLVALVCLLPSIITGKVEPDFSGKGQIGDTIGGIMGPFVAIIAAWLIFSTGDYYRTSDRTDW